MLSNQEILAATVEFINSTAASISDEELRTYQHENPNDILTDEIIKTVKERMNSELMLRMSNFMAGANVETRDDLSSRIKEWFSAGEEEHLRAMCQSCIKELIKKTNVSNEDENLSFTAKYLRAVRENSKPGGKGVHLRNL